MALPDLGGNTVLQILKQTHREEYYSFLWQTSFSSEKRYNISTFSKYAFSGLPLWLRLAPSISFWSTVIWNHEMRSITVLHSLMSTKLLDFCSLSVCSCLKYNSNIFFELCSTRFRNLNPCTLKSDVFFVQSWRISFSFITNYESCILGLHFT